MARQSRIEFIEHREQVLEKMNQNASAATLAVGTKAVNLISRQMESGYGRPIRQTGDLMRDVNFQVEDERTVNVGNALEYAPYVHEGTSRMKKRPYIQDALTSDRGKSEINEVYKVYLSKGFE